jgi:hypothetical protein
MSVEKYMHIGLRFTTYEYPPPLLTLRSLFIVSLKSISETVVSLKSTLTSTFTTYDLKPKMTALFVASFRNSDIC